MTTALALLVAAIQLLTLVAANPQLPQPFRDQAVEIANIALTEAKKAMVPVTSVTTTVIPVAPAAPEPVFSGTIQTQAPTQVPTIQPTPPVMPPQEKPQEDHSKMTVVLAQHLGVDYMFEVTVRGKDGNPSKELIIMDAPDNWYAEFNDYNPDPVKNAAWKLAKTQQMTRPTNTGEMMSYFGYRPTKSGTKTITFKGDTLTQTYTLKVD